MRLSIKISSIATKNARFIEAVTSQSHHHPDPNPQTNQLYFFLSPTRSLRPQQRGGRPQWKTKSSKNLNYFDFLSCVHNFWLFLRSKTNLEGSKEALISSHHAKTKKKLLKKVPRLDLGEDLSWMTSIWIFSVQPDGVKGSKHLKWSFSFRSRLFWLVYVSSNLGKTELFNPII